jgi:hypothetical protein
MPGWMLDNRTSEPLLWPPRVHLYIVLHLLRSHVLDVRRPHVVEPLFVLLLNLRRQMLIGVYSARQIHARSRGGCKVYHDAGLCIGVRSYSYPRCSCNAVADMDCFWNHAG